VWSFNPGIYEGTEMKLKLPSQIRNHIAGFQILTGVIMNKTTRRYIQKDGTLQVIILLAIAHWEVWRGSALGTYMRGSTPWISGGTPVILIEIFLDLPQSLQENAGIIPRSGLDCFLSKPFPIHHLPSLLLFDNTKFRCWQSRETRPQSSRSLGVQAVL
jgi:hypothetical protein